MSEHLMVFGPRRSLGLNNRLVIALAVEGDLGPKQLWCRLIDSRGMSHVIGQYILEKDEYDCSFVFTMIPTGTCAYSFYTDEACTILFTEGGVQASYSTRIFGSSDFTHNLEFLAVSCMSPAEMRHDGYNGYAVARKLKTVLKKYPNTALILRTGDQWYGDALLPKLLKETNDNEARRLIRENARAHHENADYRWALASVATQCQPDDHDAYDGQHSDENTFIDPKAGTLKPEYQKIDRNFQRVIDSFQFRTNEGRISDSPGYDYAFNLGTSGFLTLDLRTFRTPEGRLFHPDQFSGWQNAVESMRGNIDTLFVVSPVVFCHGGAKTDCFVENHFPVFLRFVTEGSKKGWLGFKWLKSKLDKFGSPRDDLRDAWSHPVNAEATDKMLSYLFSLQNPVDGRRPLTVVILSGDVHTCGPSKIYSRNAVHQTASSIVQIISSPLGYKPFPWKLEAFYRHDTKNVVELGATKQFFAQIEHHDCQRNFAHISLDRTGGYRILKVKFFLEGTEQVKELIFDLERPTKVEPIDWADDPVLEAIADLPANKVLPIAS